MRMEDFREIARKKELLRRKQRQKQIRIRLSITAAVLLLSVWGISHAVKSKKEKEAMATAEAERLAVMDKYIDSRPDMDVQLLPINEYSRPGIKLEEVKGIVIHYTANPGTTAQQNHDYFEGLADSGAASVSSHFIIGLEGEIIQCIPCNEISYASNDRNSDTVSIECCIEGENGKFNEATYSSLVELTTWLMGRYELSVDEVIRHYDVTGKNCPKYFVENEDAWVEFKGDLLEFVEQNGVEK